MTTSNRVAAGTGSEGSALNELRYPAGIFVDANLDLYVADYVNDRIQLFQPGESNGITVAGSGSKGQTIELYYPIGIVLDAEKYLFIVDQGNDRIIRSDLNGFRCLVGCYGEGSQSNQLLAPSSMSFDRSGSIFVTDRENDRIQKFQYFKESCGNTSSVIQTVYASKLTTNSSIYFHSCSKSSSYYEAIQVNVPRSGLYTVLSKSNMNTHGSIYKRSFDPSKPYENRLLEDDDSCSPYHFKLTIYLKTSITYILIVTTYDSNMTGAFSIFVSGPNNIDLKNIVNTSSIIETVYASELTTNSLTYYRACSSSSTYYEAIQVNVHRSGLYTFFSKSNMITYGSIYEENFNPSKPFENELSYDDESCELDQFRFTIDLETSITYILVTTTSHPNVTGEFSIFVFGPDNAGLKNLSKCLH
ncbi:unnamed protein product [Adineta steineri]|uniref:NHL repeat containing protein-like protein n=1 Tax=Adineta steineri TaxID=433720 RepID=A0A813X044_9BILA|nr:unnamed protein product [Adineta steineri]